MNEFTDPQFLQTSQRKFKDETWRFGRKAKYIQKKDADGNVLKYANCDWNRIFCDLCNTTWCCQSATAFTNHLKNAHQIDAMRMNLDMQEAFCRVTGIDQQSLAEDPETIEEYANLHELINEYHLLNPKTKELPINMDPISLAKCGPGLSKIFNNCLNELIVALNATPNAAANCLTLCRFIDVCNLFFININIIFVKFSLPKCYIFIT